MLFRNQTRNEFRRIIHPADTVEKIKEAFKEFDLVPRVKIIKHCDDLWYVRLTIPEIKAVSNGKGTTEITALASAYAELAERISGGMDTGLDIAPHRKIYGTKNDLIYDVMLYKYMKGYQWTHQDNLQNPVLAEDLLSCHGFVKEQFDLLKQESELMRHWVTGYSLLQDKEVKVPLLFVKWISATNGLASGNTIEEAIVHGACEIFERDAAIKFLRRPDEKGYPTIDHGSINDETVQKLLKYFKQHNIGTVIKDIGQGIYPVLAVMTFNMSLSPRHVSYNVFKAGSSFDTLEALLRCFTERMQGTTFAYELERGFKTTEEDADSLISTFFNGDCPLDLRPYKSGELKRFENETINGTCMEIDQCINIARKLDTDLIVVDHTHPVINFPTVRVIMPGVSDFIKWWGRQQTTLNFIGNLEPKEDMYEAKLMEILRSFKR